MSMLTWAEREVQLACKKEAPDRKDGEWDYGCSCYESALKGYKAMIEDDHSGTSWGFTRDILYRLMLGKPLTPIEDVPEVWDHTTWHEEGQYQCNRMSSLFKDVGPDGNVSYSDVSRVVVRDKLTGTTWHNGLADRLVGELFPITMPYWPSAKPYTVVVEEYLTDRKNGDYDTIHYVEIIKPDGTRLELNQYFAERETGFVEITEEEFRQRVAMHIVREEREKNEDHQSQGTMAENCSQRMEKC